MGENKDYVTFADDKGSVNISEDVISVIASAAVLDVEGVDGVPTTFGNDLAEFLGKKNTTRGVKIQINESTIVIDAFVMIRYGFTISDVAKDVQNTVASAVEAMTGLKVAEVNVHVCGVTFEKEK
jgi:uncharacterized alkaline shock family protein YloU